MAADPSQKPVSQFYRPEITNLPALTPWRLAFRRLCHWVGWLLVHLLTKPTVRGLENFPRKGPCILVSNHLGDTDVVVGLAFFAVMPDFFGKAELYSFPILGWIMRLYGTIWIHRGQPDRRAIRAALLGLTQGRIIALAPEGRESVTGALEEGTNGAAYLALKANVPIVPIALTGTENRNVFSNLKRLRRPSVSMTVGQVFSLNVVEGDFQQALQQGTQEIMTSLASLLPEEYQGVYRAKTNKKEIVL